MKHQRYALTGPLLRLAVLAPVVLGVVAQEVGWRPVPGRLMTRWGREVSTTDVLPEYPRPTMTRSRWLNLNGLWEYAVVARGAPCPAAMHGRILVPFCAESALSGVGQRIEPDESLWYRREFRVPDSWRGGRVLLHFGAVDWEAAVEVNGRLVGTHRGGYDPFSFDITDVLRDGTQEIRVAVWDPTDAGPQPTGKQVLDPRGMLFERVTGIWQTVWLEPVPESHIAALRVDANTTSVHVSAVCRGSGDRVAVALLDGDRPVATGRGKPGETIDLSVPEPKLWSPASPHLYDLDVVLEADGQGIDRVRGYTGLRTVSLKTDARGFRRLALNGEVLFQYGPLDQGYWPDGLYTAPADAALRYDVEITRALGFNMTRKHIKVEPERWYTWCDRLGLMVWQDMPSGGGWTNQHGVTRTPESDAQFERELLAMVRARRNHPSIVSWVVFNEGWGQFDTERLTDRVRAEDPTRLLNSASGWHDRATGDLCDSHFYPTPRMPDPEPHRASVHGEFCWVTGSPVPGHTWANPAADPPPYTGLARHTSRYLANVAWLLPLADKWLTAAVYTEIIDIETELAGLLTYDRAVVKVDVSTVAAAHRQLYSPTRPVRTIVPTAAEEGGEWAFTTTRPGDGWETLGFDDTGWQRGPGGFGRDLPIAGPIRTPWLTRDIWLRRRFHIGPGAVPRRPCLYIQNDDAAEVFVNGQPVLTADPWRSWYECVFLDAVGAAAFREGENVLAVHVNQLGGGQYIDVGISDLIVPEAGRVDLAAPWLHYGWPSNLRAEGMAIALGLPPRWPDYQHPKPATSKLLWRGRTETDLSVGVRVQLRTPTGDAGILLRVSEPRVAIDGANAYYAAITAAGGGHVFVGRMDGDDWEGLGGAGHPIKTGHWYALMARADGETIRVSVDGEEILTVRDGTHAAGTVGVRAHRSQALLERFVLTSPDGDTTPVPFLPRTPN